MNRKVVHTRTARTFLERARGLIRCPELPDSVALHLSPCRCVHTGFMNRRIDVVFLGAGRVILKIVEAMPPWRIAGHVRARSVLEFNSGEVGRLGLRRGDELKLVAHQEPFHVPT